MIIINPTEIKKKIKTIESNVRKSSNTYRKIFLEGQRKAYLDILNTLETPPSPPRRLE